MDNILHSNFLKAVESLNFRFPVAKISKDTGYGTAIVSEYLNSKKVVSEKFAKEFANVYGFDFNQMLTEPQKPAPIEGERISLNGVLPDISQKPAMQKIIEGESTESLLQAMATRILKMQTEIDLLKDAVFGKH